tara:strand:+ start:599 stop:1198 length:600 start_codon:yes stop_codon:yes gene_type:complete
MNNISEIDDLIKIISKLPGLGPKSASRILLKLINSKDELHKPLINSLASVFKNIDRCKVCGSLKSNNFECSNCKLDKKKSKKICVVETIADQWSIESSKVFDGYFHILGGTISLNINNNKNQLLVNSLFNQVKKLQIEEVILATSSTIEGQTTAFYILDILKPLNINVSKLAQGIPIGGEIESLDDGTLNSAFKNRQNF